MKPKLQVSRVSFSYHSKNRETLALSDISFTGIVKFSPDAIFCVAFTPDALVLAFSFPQPERVVSDNIIIIIIVIIYFFIGKSFQLFTYIFPVIIPIQQL